MIVLLLIPILAILPLLNSGYFSHHDIHHPVRLFLLEQGLNQGYLFPRWVGDLGFGFGYPLFNFYPPLIYYVALGFSALGFSLINSLKLMLIFGFLLGVLGSYLYARLIYSRRVSLVVAALFTYTFYHSVTVYVRGAFAEFFSYSLFPFIAYFLHGLIIKPSLKKTLGLAISFALLIVCHPLIAFPALIFIVAYFILAIFLSNNWLKAWLTMAVGLGWGLGLSAFFWFPSLLEKRFTLVDEILTRELYTYKLHFVEPQQLYFSPWGFGGSVVGSGDGLSFQIGKYYLLFLVLFLFGFLGLLIKKQFSLKQPLTKMLLFNFILLVFSYFMSLSWSQFIWDRVKFLWYLQFPWRFFTFAAFYLSLTSAGALILIPMLFKHRFLQTTSQLLLLLIALVLVIKYSQLFKPQTLYQTNGNKLTNLNQRQWVISRASFEFVPKGVATKKNKQGLTTLAIAKKDLPKQSYQILSGQATVSERENRFQDKRFTITAKTPVEFQLNTYNFPGWKAWLNNQPLLIQDNNRLKLITVKLPEGKLTLKFKFTDTPVRVIGNFISLISLLLIIISPIIVWKKGLPKHF